MSLRTLVLTAAAVTLLACAAAAQQSHLMPMAHGLPEECQAAAQASGEGQTVQRVQVPAASHRQGVSADMTEAQKGYQQSMVDMQGPMRAGMMAKDPDVGFICGMIPHHQGAIDMAEVVLRTGHNAEARRFAERVIKEQSQEIIEMKSWLTKYAGKEPSQ